MFGGRAVFFCLHFSLVVQARVDEARLAGSAASAGPAAGSSDSSSSSASSSASSSPGSVDKFKTVAQKAQHELRLRQMQAADAVGANGDKASSSDGCFIM